MSRHRQSEEMMFTVRRTTHLIRYVTLVCGIVSALAFSTESFAQSPEQKGLQIAQRAYQAARGFGAYSYRLSMTNMDSSGRRAERRLSIQVAESSSGNRSRFFVNEPASLAGTAVLSHSFRSASRANDQWVFLADQRAVRRLVSGRRTGSFLGSELTYEDLIPQEVEKFSYRWLRDESCPIGRGQCHVVQRTPRERRAGYASQIMWVHTSRLTTDQLQYFDRSGSAFKTVQNTNFRQQGGRFWQPSNTTVTNLRSGRRTVLARSGFDYSRSSTNPANFESSSFYR